MSTYSRFAEEMLIALYQETERTDQQSYTFGELIDRYGLEDKESWISRLADEWEYHYTNEIGRFLGGSARDWHVEISANGMRYIEDKYGTKDGVGTILEPAAVSTQVNVPAADRFVSLNHNQVAGAEQPLREVIDAVENGNGDPDEPNFRQRILGQLKAGRELIRAGEFKLALLHATLVAALNEIIARNKDSILAGLATNLLQYILLNGLGF